jgi:hypothetical protein
LRDLIRANVRFGSISTPLAEATRPFLSAMPPIATKTVSPSETTRCANRTHARHSRRPARADLVQQQESVDKIRGQHSSAAHQQNRTVGDKYGMERFFRPSCFLRKLVLSGRKAMPLLNMTSSCCLRR